MPALRTFASDLTIDGENGRSSERQHACMIGQVAPDVGKANGLRLSKERALCIRFAPSLWQDSDKMDTSFVIAVALGVAFVVVILAMVAVIVFQRWRISDQNAHLKQFIDENMELRQKMKTAGIV